MYNGWFIRSIKKYKIYISCVIISLITFFIMLRYIQLDSFTLDDIAQLYISQKDLSIPQIIDRLLAIDTVPPLQAILFHFWLKIVPYGIQYIRMPSIFMACISVFLCGIIGNKIRNFRTGILSSILLALSPVLMLDVAYVIRPYGLLICLSTIALAVYVKKIECMGRESFGLLAVYGSVLLLLAYSHYFGAILCGALFFSDVFLYFKKKIGIRNLFSYVFMGVMYLPWIIPAMIITNRGVWSVFWVPVPTLQSIYNLFNELFSNSLLIKLLFFVGLLFIILSAAVKTLKKEFNYKNDYIELMMSWTVLFLVIIVFVFSKIVVTKSLFFFRYYISILPYLFIISAIGLDYIVNFICENKNSRSIIIISTVIYVMVAFPKLTHTQLVASSQREYHYMAAADWLYEQPDILNNSTMVISTSGFEEGWGYFITHANSRPKPALVNGDTMLAEGLPADIVKLYVFINGRDMQQSEAEFINKDFYVTEINTDLNIQVYDRKNIK